MLTQQIFEPEPQVTMGFALPPQNAIEFPLSLTEKYQPRRIADFIGIARPKALLGNLLRKPRPTNLLFIGPPGSGKTTVALAFAQELGGSLKHIAAQKCDVAALEQLRDQLAYMPAGGWWVVLIDECDQMTDKAQLQLLSRLDGTANLRPKFGGGFEQGEPAPIIWIFTCNGRGEKQTDPPSTLLPRFQSRCQLLEFEAATDADLAAHLERVWLAEGGEPQPSEWYAYMAQGVGVRDALQRLNTDLLAGPRMIPPPRKEEQLAPPVPCRTIIHPVATIDEIRKAAARKAWETRRRNAGVA